MAFAACTSANGAARCESPDRPARRHRRRGGRLFGFEFYVQQRIAGEVEAAFAAVRASGGKASHGKVSFDLWSRTITVADIAGESAAQPPVSVKIARVPPRASASRTARAFPPTASRPPTSRSRTVAVRRAAASTYKVPRIDRQGLCRPRGPGGSSGLGVHVRSLPVRARAIRRRDGILASRLPRSPRPETSAPRRRAVGDYTYSGLALGTSRTARSRPSRSNGLTFTVNMLQAGKDREDHRRYRQSRGL